MVKYDDNIHNRLCIDILERETYIHSSKASAGLMAALSAFISLDMRETTESGSKFDIVKNFMENRGISLLLKYNKIHVYDECCTIESFRCLSLFCPNHPRNVIIIENRDGINNVIQCLHIHTKQVYLIEIVYKVLFYLLKKQSNVVKFGGGGKFLINLQKVINIFGDSYSPEFFILICQICERLAFHTPTRRMMQKMKFVDSIHQKRFKYQQEKDCVRAVKMCISQLSSLA